MDLGFKNRKKNMCHVTQKTHKIVVVVVVVQQDRARVARDTHATSADPRGPSGARSVPHVQHLVVEVEQEVPNDILERALYCSCKSHFCLKIEKVFYMKGMLKP